MSQDPFSELSLIELFHQEAENQTAILTQGLLAVEREPASAQTLEALMRAAHSIKGAARIVGLDAAVRVAHALEDCFVAAQKGRIVLEADAVDALLCGVDLLSRIALTPEEQAGIWTAGSASEIERTLAAVLTITEGKTPVQAATPVSRRVESVSTAAADAEVSPAPPVAPVPASEPSVAGGEGRSDERVLRVAAANLNRLLGLAGEALVESRWLSPFAESLLRLKRQEARLSETLEKLRESLSGLPLTEAAQSYLAQAQQQAAANILATGDRHGELELYSRRSTNLSQRLYQEVIASRMRPFSDGVHGFARMVRDLSRRLCKEVELQIVGEATPVDRDVLERLESPLGHLLRNAVDHGLEFAVDRIAAGKPRKGTIRLEARHVAGLLMISIEDDGRGIPLERLREAVIAKGYTTGEVARTLSEEELLDFLFLPGFTLRDEVTDISGRGVGLDVVHTMVKEVGGSVRLSTQPGGGTRFALQLPLTLSVMRFLLVEVAGEPYALPLARLTRTLQVPLPEIQTLEGREHVPFEGQRVGVVSAAQIFGKTASPSGPELSVVILGERAKRYGVVVDRFLGERQLVVQPLDPRLGQIKDISAGALMPDGSPVLILNADDLMRSVELLVSGGRLDRVQTVETSLAGRSRKRVLVVDDSLTVRELERKLIGNAGYEVEAAIDGMDGWNAVRTQPFDLVVTDIDMPRLDGIELVRLIKNDPRLKTLPVMIVSYKDRPEDRNRGLEAGADYYLTKGSFHDETLLDSIADLIGPPLSLE